MLYPVAIDHQAQGFVAHVPDLPALTIEGDNVADVIRNARVAIGDYLQAMVDQGEPLPKVRDLSVHLDNADFYGCIWAIVSLESAYFVPKVTDIALKLPQNTLSAIHQHLKSSDPQAIQAFIVETITQRLNGQP